MKNIDIIPPISRPPRARRIKNKNNEANVPVRERVLTILKLLARGEWYGAKSHVEYSERWKISISQVKKASAEAYRTLTLDPDDLAQARLELANYCAALREQAKRERSTVSGLIDLGGAIKAAELEAKFKGINLEQPLAQGGPALVEVRVITEPVK